VRRAGLFAFVCFVIFSARPLTPITRANSNYTPLPGNIAPSNVLRKAGTFRKTHKLKELLLIQKFLVTSHKKVGELSRADPQLRDTGI